MVVGKWQSLKWVPEGLNSEASVLCLPLAALTHLSLIIASLPAEGFSASSQTWRASVNLLLALGE